MELQHGVLSAGLVVVGQGLYLFEMRPRVSTDSKSITFVRKCASQMRLLSQLASILLLMEAKLRTTAPYPSVIAHRLARHALSGSLRAPTSRQMLPTISRLRIAGTVQPEYQLAEPPRQRDWNMNGDD